MSRLLSIDFGRKRCGIAVTDPLRLVAGGLTTVATAELISFIRGYMSREDVGAIIVGKPTTLRGEPSESARYLEPMLRQLAKAISPDTPIVLYDERFTSVLAHKAMIDGGMRKMARRDKAIVDEISATIILNDYLQSKQYTDLHK